MILALQSAPNAHIRRSSRGRFVARVIGALAGEFLRGMIGGMIAR